MRPVLILDQIRKSFFDPGRGEVRAVDDLCLRLEPGVIALVGANGAGKSTLLRLISTLLVPDAGRITWAGIDLATRPEDLRRRLGYLSTTTRLTPRLTAREVLRHIGHLYGLEGQDLEGRIAAQVAAFGLERVLDQRLDGLSTGERQRVNLARTLLADPDLGVLDEPATGLDLVAAAQVRTAVRQARRTDRLILLATHHLDEVEALADRLLVLRQGRLAYDGPPAGLGQGEGLRQAVLGLMEEVSHGV
jgi:ABC-type multidrug transport system ATPase subunit